MEEIVLSPGWLKRDIAKAQARFSSNFVDPKVKTNKPANERFEPVMTWRCSCENVNYRHWENCGACGKHRPKNIGPAS
jgi:hypothetical protein